MGVILGRSVYGGYILAVCLRKDHNPTIIPYHEETVSVLRLFRVHHVIELTSRTSLIVPGNLLPFLCLTIIMT